MSSTSKPEKFILIASMIDGCAAEVKIQRSHDANTEEEPWSDARDSKT